MAPEQNWNPPAEDDGITLGPEDALSREIEKSKSLKVERLKLRDEIEKLRRRNAQLSEKAAQLQEELEALRTRPSPGRREAAAATRRSGDSTPPSPLAFFVLILNLLALGILIFLQTRN